MTGQQLIDRWAAWFRQYVVMTQEQALVLALWAVHTWLYEHFGATPYLSITASAKRSGKTTVLKLLKIVCRNGLELPTIRAISISRAIEAFDGKVTVLIDEAEKLRAASLGDTRSILATGYQSGATHMVTTGKEVETFRTYAPKAFATIGDIQPILHDRAIVFDLMRGNPSRMFTLCRLAAESEGTELVAQFVEWMKANKIERVPAVDPDWLTSPRDREIWAPLFGMAAMLNLGKRETDSLIAFSVDNENFKRMPLREYHSAQDETDADDRMISDRALRDLHAAFTAGDTFLPSSVAVERMRSDPRAPWRNWRTVAGLNEINLANLVSVFGVTPAQARTTKGRGGERARGYRRADVEAAIDKVKTGK